MRILHNEGASVIYYLKNVQQIEESHLREFSSFLSPERRDKIARYRFPKDRVQSALAYLLLRYGLIKDYGILWLPKIECSPQGKPFLPEHPHLHFNLSHCERAVACGFSSRPIGVDVQHPVPYKESLAQYFMTPEERKGAILGDSDRTFTRLWTLKEAYGKYSGTGICYSMSDTPITEGLTPEGCVIESYWLEGFCLSVCSREVQRVEGVSLRQLRECFACLQ